MKTTRIITVVLVIATIFIGLILSYLFSGRDVREINIQENNLHLGKVQAPTSQVVISPISNSSGSGKCDMLITEIDMSFEEAKRCEIDSDCIVESRGMYCPFGCYQIHNKNYNIDEIMQRIVEFQNEGCILCEYSCMTMPTQGDIKCRENRCIDIRYNTRNN